MPDGNGDSVPRSGSFAARANKDLVYKRRPKVKPAKRLRKEILIARPAARRKMMARRAAI